MYSSRGTSTVNILHLTDLHFNASSTGSAARLTASTSLLTVIDDLRSDGHRAELDEARLDDWRPDIVVVSGDIAYAADEAEYEIARGYFERLLAALGLEPTRVVICPGNHDRNLVSAHGLTYPGDVADADRWLAPQALGSSPITAPFENFQSFCESSGFQRPAGLAGLEYLTGLCEIDLGNDRAVDFLVANSAWFSQPGGSDMRNLWLGLPLLEELDASKYASPPRESVKRIRIGVCHHPREWLSSEEHDSYTTRPNTYRYFAERCDIILNGHVHGSLEPPSLAHNVAQTFTGGATYAGGRYRNNFSLLQVNLDDMSVRRRGFEYDPRIARWEELTSSAGAYQLKSSAQLRDPDLSVDDLSGTWVGEYWPENSRDLRRPVQRLTMTLDDVGWPGVTTDTARHFVADEIGDDTDDLHLSGVLSRGFFTGIWSDARRDGSFQLKLLPGDVLWGRWLGYDGENEIRVGVWRFVREGSPEDST